MIQKKLNILLILLVCTCFHVLAESNEYKQPNVSEMIALPSERVDYLVMHYWDRFDFNDKGVIDNADVVEQVFSNFLAIVPYANKKNEALAHLYAETGANAEVITHFIDLTTKYLYEKESPLYDEELYIVALNELMACAKVPADEKERLTYSLATAMKNRVGHKATNFSFLRKDGRRGTLYTIKADYILLYFNDPTCDECKKVKEELISSPHISKAIEEDQLRVVSVCVEGKTDAWKNQSLPYQWIDVCDERMYVADRELYALPSMPVLYLLDKGYRVVQKNTDVLKIDEFFNKR